MEFSHIPVLLNETIDGLMLKKDGIYVDCTLGGAGHSFYIAKQLGQNGRLIGIDKDCEAINAASKRLSCFSNITYVNDDFKNLGQVLSELGIDGVDGILIDLGVSSYQLDNPDRGFSFRFNSKLDMRMDCNQELSAYDVVNTYSEESLAKIIFEYGEEMFARQIARNIVKFRSNKPVETTGELTQIIESSMPKKYVYTCGGASKKTFQAIRIEVNGELDGLEKLLFTAISKLKSGGRLCVISFHSLEDRIVKNVFKKESSGCICPPEMPICTCGHKASVKLINKKPLIASKDELALNSRSSCAKLRIIEKI